MAEYIEREALKSQIAENKLMAREPATKRILAMIDDMPAADIAPVVHGKWLNFYNDFSCAECDRCGTIFEVTDNETDEGLWNAFLSAYRYCPDCGAKMDEEEHNNV